MHWGKLHRSSDPLAGFWEEKRKGGEEMEREWKGKWEDKREWRREGRKGEGKGDGWEKEGRGENGREVRTPLFQPSLRRWIQANFIVTGSSDSSDWNAVCGAVNVPAMRFVIRRSVVELQSSSVLHVRAAGRTLLGHVRDQAWIQRAVRHHQILERHRTVIYLFYFIYLFLLASWKPVNRHEEKHSVNQIVQELRAIYLLEMTRCLTGIFGRGLPWDIQNRTS